MSRKIKLIHKLHNHQH